MNINIKNLGFLFLVWAFFFLLGGAVSVNVPFILLVIATIIYLIT